MEVEFPLSSIRLTFSWKEEADATRRSSWWPGEVAEPGARTVEI